jgi:hypothetical protein
MTETRAFRERVKFNVQKHAKGPRFRLYCIKQSAKARF